MASTLQQLARVSIRRGHLDAAERYLHNALRMQQAVRARVSHSCRLASTPSRRIQRGVSRGLDAPKSALSWLWEKQREQSTL